MQAFESSAHGASKPGSRSSTSSAPLNRCLLAGDLEVRGAGVWKRTNAKTVLRNGVTTVEQGRIKALDRENRQLRKVDETLRKASAYLAPPIGDCVAISRRARGRSSTAHFGNDYVHPRTTCRLWGHADLPRLLQIAPSAFHAHQAVERDPT